MTLDPPLRTLDALQRQLDDELERSRQAHQALRSFDAQALLAHAGARAAFNAAAARGLADLDAQLRAAAAEGGLSQPTTEALCDLDPEHAGALRDGLAALRQGAQALAREDERHQQLAQRAMSYVKGYLAALAPPRPAAYDRRGALARPATASGDRAVCSRRA
jgi:hypothetical protein